MIGLVLAAALAQAGTVPEPSPPPLPGEPSAPVSPAPVRRPSASAAPAAPVPSATTPAPPAELTPPPPPPTAPAPSGAPGVTPPPPPPSLEPLVPPAAPTGRTAPAGTVPVVYPPDRPRKDDVLAPAKGAVTFAPMSLFGLYFSVELEVALPVGLSLFVGGGGGLFGQVGFEGGLRYAVLGTALEGAFLDVHGQGFFLPGQSFGMAGPGLMVGYNWRSKAVLSSIGVGVDLWWTVLRTPTSRGLAGATLTSSFVFPLAGFWEPPAGRNAVQPTIRLSFGPWF